MVHRIRRIDVMQLAKVMGVLYFLMGIVFLAFYLVFSFSMPGAHSETFMRAGSAMFFLMPVFYGLLGVVFGALTAALYNFVAGMLGGVELDLEPTGPNALP